MKQYQDLLRRIVSEGEDRLPSRIGLPATRAVFDTKMEFDIGSGFPILTTKKISFKNIINELLWFLSGDTNISFLIKRGCNIWNKDALRYAKEQLRIPDDFTMQDYLSVIQKHPDVGDCGKIYGYQWRHNPDQILLLIKSLIENPNSRYHIVDAWDSSSFLIRQDSALPACHVLFQCYVTNTHKLNLSLWQRSCDTFLGVPYNIASYALLLHILAAICDYTPGRLTWHGMDTHVYDNHMQAIDECLSREPMELPQLITSSNFRQSVGIFREQLKEERINHTEELTTLFTSISDSDFRLINYNPYPPIAADMSEGSIRK